ncbi:Macrolide export ATP-binding/permease protein MacB [Minicystis rosea]|nr:Macrolide export ATP-binding/permease protein MacB [Minicystis rosea]
MKRKQLGFAQRASRFVSELIDAVVQAARSLVAHKLRAALTISGVSVGIMAVIVIFMVEAGMETSFARQLNSLGPNTLYVHKWAWGVNNNEWWKLRNRPAVGQGDYRALLANAKLPIAIAPVANTEALVMWGERELKHIDVRGTTEAFLDAGGWQLRRGRFISDLDHELGTDACVIGADVEDAFFKGQDPLGQRLKVGPTARCTVVGSLVRKGNAFGRSQDGLLVLPLSAFRRSFGQKRGLTIAVVAPDGKVAQTEDEIIAVLRTARRLGPDKEDNFSVNRQDKILQGFNQTMMMTNLVGILVGVITAIVAGIGIMNILLVSVKERTREIGIRRALGARRASVLLQFLCEAVMVALVGGALGVAMGAGAAALIDLVSPMPASIDPRVVVGGVLGSCFLGAAFGLWPALSAALLHPIEALRHE